MRLARALQLYRVTEGLSLNKLAKEIGLDPSQLCRIEQGREARSPAVAKLIAWLFDSPKAGE
jgi:transcriptional regulator with XRE-family HTH domain